MSQEQLGHEHREQGTPPSTPREAAKDLIRLELRQGSNLARMLEEHPSSWWQTEHYSATVGGTMFRHLGSPDTEYLPLEVDQIGVWKLAGQECWEIFSLHELYAEVWREDHGGQDPDELLEQGQLFSSPPEAFPDRKGGD
jgi:hypothetical protein